MRKQIISSALLWLIAGLILSIFTIDSGSIIGLMMTVMWGILPFVTFLMNLTVKNHVTADLELPATVEKRTEFHGKLTITNDSVFSVPKLVCRIRVTNLLTGEMSEHAVVSAASKKEPQKIDLQFSSEHCGYLKAEVTRLYLMDWIGFLPVFCKCHAEGKVSVLPDTFWPEVSLTLSSVAQEDADSWSPYQKGNDLSEIFALRDYVSGDSLKQIHWKLSSKRQKLIVKEPSLPVEKSLLIFWNKNTRTATGKEMDAMAECMVSLCQAILEQGITFTVGWTEGAVGVFENIDSDEELLAAIPRMLKHGVSVSEGIQISYRNESQQFGKTIYLAGTCPEQNEFFTAGETVLLLCGQEQESYDIPTICFGADTYEEDLEMMEL